MDKWLAETVTVDGMTGTRAEYINYLVYLGWDLDEAIRIACHAKAA